MSPGGGEVAARKINRLLAAGAEVTAIAPAFCAEIAEDCARGLLCCKRRAFALDDIAALDPFIVFAATDDVALNKAIAAYCDEARILVNAITDPQNGNFSVQADDSHAPATRCPVSTYGAGAGICESAEEYLEPVLDERLDLAVEVYTACASAVGVCGRSKAAPGADAPTIIEKDLRTDRCWDHRS